MNQYYIAIMAITCSTLIVLSFLVRENDRIEPASKSLFYRAYLFITLAAVSEFASVGLNGTPQEYRMLHSFVKSLDYALTPIAAVYFVRQLSRRDIFQRVAEIVLTVNAALAVLSNFTGWYFYLDAENYYHHGPLYFLYFVVYALTCAFAMIEFMMYARRFTHKNYASICGIWLFLAVFIAVQQFVDSNLRVVYLSMSICCVLVFAHYCQYRLQESTATITHQQDLLERDALTDLYNRYSYIHTLDDYEQQGRVPPELIAISIDVNGLKRVNDSLGHQAGDDLLCGAARVILDTFGPYGKCFRTGGDEFIVILNLLKGEDAKARCQALLASLQEEAAAWKGQIVSSVSLSCGYAAAVDHPDLSVEKLVSIADSYMYRHKEAYYSACGSRR